ncbi:MAG: c-type cytochrome [Alkalilacustris sp.]
MALLSPRALLGVGVAALIGAAAFIGLTRAAPLPTATQTALAALQPDPQAGEAVFWAAGCASCHAAPSARGEDRLLLSGGRRFETEFGTFVAPNISTDPDHGIGGWTLAEFANAVMAGVSPDGRHYYPAFPYTSYRLAELQDIADLKAFMDSLPASDRANEAHALGFPYAIRRGVGLWKRLALEDGWAVTGDLTEQETRGRYLSEALAHCAECHTPRDRLGRLDRDRWLAGAPNPSGSGRIPGITPATLDWSAAEIAGYLASGFTPSFDTVGGTMAAVVASLGQLPREDLDAIAAYLARVPPVE